MARNWRSMAWATGGMIFAATMMVMIGAYQLIMGFAAVMRDSFFVIGADYFYEVDTVMWGWIHMAIGALVLLTGLAVYSGATWARAVGIGFALVSAVANFLFLPYYPLWTLVIIAMDVFVIWSLATARAISDDTGPAPAMGSAATAMHSPSGDWEAMNRPAATRPGMTQQEPATPPAPATPQGQTTQQGSPQPPM